MGRKAGVRLCVRSVTLFWESTGPFLQPPGARFARWVRAPGQN